MSAEQILVRMSEESDARIKRAVDAGGLPTEEEVREQEKLMQAAFDLLEQLTSRVNGIADSDVGDELPSVISLEEIGNLAVLISLLHRYVDEFGQMETKMLECVHPLSAIREEQLARWMEKD